MRSLVIALFAIIQIGMLRGRKIHETHDHGQSVAINQMKPVNSNIQTPKTKNSDVFENQAHSTRTYIHLGQLRRNIIIFLLNLFHHILDWFNKIIHGPQPIIAVGTQGKEDPPVQPNSQPVPPNDESGDTNQTLNVTSLRFVHAIWRHGDRTPAFQYPRMESVYSRWRQERGALTSVGKEQQKKLGAYLRKRYIDSGFLSNDYNRNEVVWPEHPCPVAKNILENEILQSNQVKKLKRENRDVVNLVYKYTGLKMRKMWLYDMVHVYDPLNCERLHNMTWPTWVTPQYFYKIRQLAFEYYKLYVHDPRLHRLRGGLLFDEIATRFEQKAKKFPTLQPPTLKYYAYSAHDSTLLTQLENYGAYDGILPPYASALLYELHEKQHGKFTVQIWYIKDQGDTPPSRIKFQNCGEVCDLDKFVALATKLGSTKQNYYSQCKWI